jgi:hypothetical protein
MQSDNLLSLKDDMVAFISGHGLLRMHGHANETVPSILFEEDHSDSWKEFVELAKAANAAFVTMSEVALEKADLELLIEELREQQFPHQDMDSPTIDDAQSMVQHVGQIGFIQLGFIHQGIVIIYEASTEWYDRYQMLVESLGALDGILMDDSDDDDNA